MFTKDDDIEPMMGLIAQLPTFNFLSFDKTDITRTCGGGSSKSYFSPRSRFLEKRERSALYWGGKGMQIEVPYYSGVVCFDAMIIMDAPTIIEDSGLWWARCNFRPSRSIDVKRQLRIMMEQSLLRPMAITGVSSGDSVLGYTAYKIGFTSETDATLYALTTQAP